MRRIHMEMMTETLEQRKLELLCQDYQQRYLPVDEFSIHKGPMPNAPWIYAVGGPMPQAKALKGTLAEFPPEGQKVVKEQIHAQQTEYRQLKKLRWSLLTNGPLCVPTKRSIFM